MEISNVENREPSKLELAKEALELAKGIIDYCGGGDAWERECNAPAMERFEEIYKVFFPPPPPREPLPWEPHHCICPVCERGFGDRGSRDDHIITSKVHAKKLERMRVEDPEAYRDLHDRFKGIGVKSRSQRWKEQKKLARQQRRAQRAQEVNA